jgi:sugar lactone lactonase YvrE
MNKAYKIFKKPCIYLIFQIGLGFMVNAQDKIFDQINTVVDSLPQSVGGMSVDGLGYLYAADFEETVWKINPYTGKSVIFADGFYGATGNGFDSRGRFYQANSSGNYISRVSRSGEKEIFADSLFSNPIGLAVNSRNELFVCNCGARNITKVSPEGESEIFAKSAYLNCPNGIALDVSGNLYVVSYNNNNIVKITPEGESSLFARTPDKIGNGHVALANDKIYVTGFHGHRLYEVTMEGEVSILAGTGARGGLDGAALSSTLSYPNGIAVSPNGKTLYLNERHKEKPHSPLLNPAYFSIRSIKLSFISDMISNEIEANGTNDVMNVYKRLKNHPKFSNLDTELEMNNLGFEYLYVGNYKEASIVFQMNIESYPGRVLAYAFMGRTMDAANELQEAIQYFKKALAILPDNEVLKSRLKQVEDQMKK